MKSQSPIPGDKSRLPCMAQCPQVEKQAGASHTPDLSSDGLRKQISPALESRPLHTPADPRLEEVAFHRQGTTGRGALPPAGQQGSSLPPLCTSPSLTSKEPAPT